MKTVTFSGSPTGGERVAVTINGTPVAYTATKTDTLTAVVQTVAEAANRVGSDVIRARVAYAGATLQISGEYPGPSWEPAVAATADAPISVSVA